MTHGLIYPAAAFDFIKATLTATYDFINQL